MELTGRAWRWLWWTAVSFPVAVLSHEFAHYLAYRVFGFRGASLHYGSASYAASDAFWQQMHAGDVAAATQLAPLLHVGVASAAGLVATYVTVTACVLVARRRPHPFVVGLGLIAAIRSVGSVLILIMAMLGRRGTSGSDEAHVAMTLHIPEVALHVLGIAVLVASWAILLRLPSRDTKWGTAAVLSGIVVGGVAYIGLLGPWLLP